MSSHKYRAFISYSHADKRWGEWLHRALETYRVPPRLVGQETTMGTVPDRVRPVFRDREELPTATELGDVINRALEDSSCLIVVCSPRSANSRWVNEEVLAFKRLGRSDRILCLIVDGEPNASDKTELGREECFPEALRFRMSEDGRLTDERTEPVAADVRRGGDGKQNAKLKLLAGLLGVGYDDLRQREHQRRQRRLAWLSAAAVVGLAITSGLAIRAYLAQQEAERERDRADTAAAEAREEAATSRRVSALLTDIFARFNPSVARGAEVTVRDVLRAGAEQVLAELDNEPEVQMRLLAAIGDSYRGLARWNEAADILEKSLAIAVATYGEESVEAARAKWLLSYPLIHTERFDRAERLNREALATMRRLLPPGDPAIGDPIGRLTFTLLRAQRDASEMIPLLQESLALEKKAYGTAHDSIALTLDMLGWVLMSQGRYAEAEASLAEALEVVDTLYEDGHPRTGYVLFRYAIVLSAQGRHEEALVPARRLVVLAKRLYGGEHPEVAYASVGLGRVQLNLGQWSEAVQSTAQAVQMMRAFTGAENSELGGLLLSHGRALDAAGRLAEADAVLAEAEQSLRASLGESHESVARSLRERGDVARRLGQFERSESLLRQALDIRARHGRGQAAEAIDRTFLAMTLMGAGRVDEACSEAETAYNSLVSSGIEVGRDVALTFVVMGHCHALRDDIERADPLLREGMEVLEVAYPPGHPVLETAKEFDRSSAR